MRKRLLFIYNPHAGKGKIKHLLYDIFEIFSFSDYEIVVYPTRKHGDATEYVKENAENFNRIICCGGDGTLHEVVNGVMNSKKNIPIGYIPMGSTNDFGNSLNIDTSLDEIRNFIRNDTKKYDIGKFNDEYFVYVAGFGIFTSVSHETPQEMKNSIGHMAYVIESLKELNKIKSYHIKLNTPTTEIEDDIMLCIVTNSKSVGGIKDIINEKANLSDGLFEVLLIKYTTNITKLNEIVLYLLGLIETSNMVYELQTKSLTIESDDDIVWTLDGENGGVHNKVEIINLNKHLKLLN